MTDEGEGHAGAGWAVAGLDDQRIVVRRLRLNQEFRSIHHGMQVHGHTPEVSREIKKAPAVRRTHGRGFLAASACRTGADGTSLISIISRTKSVSTQFPANFQFVSGKTSWRTQPVGLS